MMLKAIGKYIDTSSLKNLFSQEEARMDFIIIEVDRYYDGMALDDFIFVMRGMTESGAETEVVLQKTVRESDIRLIWEVGRLFTAETGKLLLDLVAYKYQNPDTDRTQNLPDYVLRYQLPPVEVRGLPEDCHKQTETEGFVTAMAQFREALIQLQANDSAQANQIQDLQNRIKILVLTQAEYDALENPDNQVLYVIK